MLSRKKKVLFVCVQNSARSQMAEAFLNQFCGDVFKAESDAEGKGATFTVRLPIHSEPMLKATHPG